MSTKKGNLDEVDRRILSVLSEDARYALSQIADELSVSNAKIHSRYEKLKERGILKGTRCLIDYEEIGYGVSAFVGIKLQSPSKRTAVSKKVSQLPYVTYMSYTTGDNDIFLKIVVKDVRELSHCLFDEIQTIPGVASTKSTIVLQEQVDRVLNLEESD